MARANDAGRSPARRHDHERCVARALSAAETVCDRRGARLTALRRRVLALVWRSHAPVGAYDILAQLMAERGSAQPPTVYRALDFLLEQGLIHRLESLNAYVGCGTAEEPHDAQFLLCTGCGDATELADRRVAEAIDRAAADRGFQVAGRVVEVRGVCPACRAEGPAGHG